MSFRITHTLTIGQSSSMKLTVRGDHAHRKVSCFSYSAPVVSVCIYVFGITSLSSL